MKRGTATIAALVLLSLVGVATAVLTTRVADAAERTRRATDDAQFRTLLLSAAAFAQAKVESQDRTERTIEIPVTANQSASCIIKPDVWLAGEASIRAEIRLDSTAAHATYTFKRADDRWLLTKSELGNAAN